MTLFKLFLLGLFLLIPPAVYPEDGSQQTKDARYFGNWKGSWLEGMSSGKIALKLDDVGGELTFTALPAFGTEAVGITKINGNAQRLMFQTSGANGRVMRFDLKPNAGFDKLVGKAYYESLHMELELARAP